MYNLDRFNSNILRILQKNGRISNIDLADRGNLGVGDVGLDLVVALNPDLPVTDFLSEGWVIFTPRGPDRSRSRYAGELRRAGEDLRVSQILIGANLARPAGDEPAKWCAE